MLQKLKSIISVFIYAFDVSVSLLFSLVQEEKMWKMSSMMIMMLLLVYLILLQYVKRASAGCQGSGDACKEDCEVSKHPTYGDFDKD